MGVVEEVVIFNDWLTDNGVLGQWARSQILNKNWKKLRRGTRIDSG